MRRNETVLRTAALAAVSLTAAAVLVGGAPLPGLQVQAAHAGDLGLTRFTNLQATPGYHEYTVRGKLTEATLGVLGVPMAPIHVEFHHGTDAAECNTTTGLTGEFECFASAPWVGPTAVVTTFNGTVLFARTIATFNAAPGGWAPM